MRLDFVYAVLSSLFVIPIAALPGLEERAYCVKDQCLNAVLAGPGNVKNNAASSSARRDCASFLAKTVTPCPVTVTKTVTSFKGGAVVSLTQRTTVTDLTSVTIPTTKTIIQTTTDTTTVLTTATVTVMRNKRALLAAGYGEAIPEALQVRDGGGPARCPATQTGTRIPPYARCSSRPSAYSSACSCAGVTKGSTTTLPASTATKTTTVVKPGNPSVTRTTTVRLTETDEITSTISTLITLWDEEETVTTTTTSTATVTTTV